MGGGGHPIGGGGIGLQIDFSEITTILTEIRDCVCVLHDLFGIFNQGGNRNIPNQPGVPNASGGSNGNMMIPGESASLKLSEQLKSFNENFGGGNSIKHTVTLMDNNINVNVMGLESLSKAIKAEVLSQVGDAVTNQAKKIGADGGGTGNPGPAPGANGPPQSSPGN